MHETKNSESGITGLTLLGINKGLNPTPSAKQPEIFKALEELGFLCEDLDTKINILENRLQVVSRNPDAEKNGNNIPIQPFESEIAQKIGGRSSNIAYQINRLTKMIELLEI